mgnify:FL=1
MKLIGHDSPVVVVFTARDRARAVALLAQVATSASPP